VIVSSGFVSDSLHEQVRCAGARAVLQKENTLEELASLIRRVLDEPATASVAA